jgi:hypothetical protein
MRIRTNHSNRTEIMEPQIKKLRHFEQLEPKLKKEDNDDMHDPNILLDAEPNIINANTAVQNNPSSVVVPINRPTHSELETEEDSKEFETITLELILVNTEESFGDPLGQDMLDTVNRNVLSEIVNCCSKFNARTPTEEDEQHERHKSFKTYRERKAKSNKENGNYF